MRNCFAVFAILFAGVLASSASAMGTHHFRASHQNGGQHYRASHGHHSHSKVVFSSRCRGPVVVTTWQPSHRLYRSGFGHFSRPTVVSSPTVFRSSRGYRSSLGGFAHGHRSAYRRGPVCSYNGSVGSNLASQRSVNWKKRAKVHSPKVTVHGESD